MDIKPIETFYNGYHFRSRLEARWAVFFDAAKIKYHYEPEGFVLYDGTQYLPDFYLDDFELYVEIKPFDKSVVSYVGDGNKWEQKCKAFRDSTDKAILLCYGDPAENSFYMLFAFDVTDSGGGSSEYLCKFVEFCNRIVLCTEPERTDREICINNYFERNSNVGTPAEFAGDRTLLFERALKHYEPSYRDLLNKAKTEARQARFEHGETPHTNTTTYVDGVKYVNGIPF